ncbi:hypothetical protein [uncultured Nostoc sp.]
MRKNNAKVHAVICCYPEPQLLEEVGVLNDFCRLGEGEMRSRYS